MSGSNNDPSASPRRRQIDTEARRKSVELSRMRMVGAITEDPRARRRPPAPAPAPPPPLSPAAPGAAEDDSPAGPAPAPPPAPASDSSTPLPPPPLGSYACRNWASAVRIVCAWSVGAVVEGVANMGGGVTIFTWLNNGDPDDESTKRRPGVNVGGGGGAVVKGTSPEGTCVSSRDV